MLHANQAVCNINDMSVSRCDIIESAAEQFCVCVETCNIRDIQSVVHVHAAACAFVGALMV